MHWKGLRPSAAGGRKSRRHSFFERNPQALDGQHGAKPEDMIAQAASNTESQVISRQSSRSASPRRSLPTPQAPDSGHTVEDIPQRLRNGNAATIPRSHRFSLLKFRHASDPQLSRSYVATAPGSTPPVPVLSSKSLILRLPKWLWTDLVFFKKHPRL